MNNIKNEFSIKDLEHLSGIKAHTIRIWEKRYNLLSPNRTETNIRTYSIESLQKLLNVTALYNNGHKISKISYLNDQEIVELAKNLTISNNENHVLNTFKIATINFDKALFLNTYKKLEEQHSFQEIFHEFFMPLLEEVGFLWQTNTITPAQEHFISELIKQKILVNIEYYQAIEPKISDKVYVLFLPDGEIHELGLQYVNYELTKLGLQTIYLGGSVPIDSLIDLTKNYNLIEFITYFTVNPTCEDIHAYLEKFFSTILSTNENQLHVLGRQVSCINEKNLPKSVHLHNSIENLVKEM